MDYDPILTLEEIDNFTRLPQLTVEEKVTETVDTLVAILKPGHMTNLPKFLKFIDENELLKEDLLKNKSIFLYGREKDKYRRCFIRVSSLHGNLATLTEASELTRTLLMNEIGSFGLYFSKSMTPEQISRFIQGISLTNYKFQRKSEPETKFIPIESITIYHPTFTLESEQVQYNLKLARYPLFCRELVNSRALEANPQTMLELCKQVARIDSKISIETIVGQELYEKGLNLIYSMGLGASKPSCLVVLKYEGNPEKQEEKLALIGKGVCFDAGGLNIKHTGNIENTYFDKAGACAVLAVFRGIVEMNLPVNVVCGMAFIENLVGPNAIHPSDIIKAYNGLAVEVGNTSTGSYLAIADTISYIQTIYKPQTIIEVSTLNSAVKNALGDNLAGLITKNQKLETELVKAGTRSGEELWPLPLVPKNKRNMKSSCATLTNNSKSSAADASNAAAFLDNFIEKSVKWAHLEISGTAFTTNERFIYNEGATGFGVLLLFAFLKNRQEKLKQKDEKLEKMEQEQDEKNEEDVEDS